MNALLAASALALASVGPESDHAHGPQLGKVLFDSSCNAAAKPLLQRGLEWLHSFEYEEAAKSLSKAAAADSRCGIAHWGVAMSYYHPLWAPPTPAELEKGRAAVTQAKKAGAGSVRERDLIAAIDYFYRDFNRVDHGTRVLDYTSAMERLHRRYREDREIAVFYSLALIAAGTMDNDPTFKKEHMAGAILNAVFKEQPDHPGVAHYLIHSFDYPPLAELALPAAQRYANIAPASAHAQHMPSHIFIRLGMWEEAIKSNLAAEASARAYAQSHGLADSWDERLHAMDYLAYAYLQTGRGQDAQRVLDELNAIKRADPPNFKVAYAATAVPARLALARRNWRQAALLELSPQLRALAPLEKMQWADAHIHFAKAVGAARGGDTALARQQVVKLEEIERSLTIPPGEYDWRTQVSVERQVAEAWLAYAQNEKEEAVRLMRVAADLDDATEKHPVTPGQILTARGQLGEMLLELGRPDKALPEFEASLKRNPRRLDVLYGASRAAKFVGDTTKADRYYADLAEMTKDGDATRTEVREARAYIAEVAAR